MSRELDLDPYSPQSAGHREYRVRRVWRGRAADVVLASSVEGVERIVRATLDLGGRAVVEARYVTPWAPVEEGG